jgi:hypothetical protein
MHWRSSTTESLENATSHSMLIVALCVSVVLLSSTYNHWLIYTINIGKRPKDNIQKQDNKM